MQARINLLLNQSNNDPGIVPAFRIFAGAVSPTRKQIHREAECILGTNIGYNLAYIPGDFPDTSTEAFDKLYMSRLFEVGVKQTWTKWRGMDEDAAPARQSFITDRSRTNWKSVAIILPF